MRSLGIVVLLSIVASCGGKSKPKLETPKPPPPDVTTTDPTKPSLPEAADCGGKPMTVHFFDAGQALAALVILPDGKRILVDAGESPKKSKDDHQRVLDGLAADLGANLTIDMLWITHQHSDHLGGVPGVAGQFAITNYVHNGTTPKPLTGVYTDAIAAAQKEARMTVVEPGTTTLPIDGGPDVTLTAIVPSKWPSKCETHANDCSILLRIDYCDSSVLFTGDAEEKEEDLITVKAATLLQVGHHGSDTSSSPAFLKQIEPKYAVISSGKPFKGTNVTYCHPVKRTIESLNAAMGGTGAATIRAFNGKDNGPTCKASNSNPADWSDVPANDSIFATPRDGGIKLTTTGDGKFSVDLGQ